MLRKLGEKYDALKVVLAQQHGQKCFPAPIVSSVFYGTTGSTDPKISIAWAYSVLNTSAHAPELENPSGNIAFRFFFWLTTVKGPFSQSLLYEKRFRRNLTILPHRDFCPLEVTRNVAGSLDTCSYRTHNSA